MSRRKTISIFEHQYIRVGENGFEDHHFERLVAYNELHGNKYFTVGLKKIKFSNYVGVIQVGNLTIEILPKADFSSDQEKWRFALLAMLFQCKHISLQSLTEAYLKLRTASIMDLILESFLLEVEYLLSIGLVKGYRKVSSNKTNLKGKIEFSQHVSRNIIHKELFYTISDTYDYNIIWNRILRKALDIVLLISSNATIRSKTEKVSLCFEGIQSGIITGKLFQNLRYNRKTEAYKKAIKLAELIILSYNPDIQFGKNYILAVMFDMNRLFEEYVYRILKKDEGLFPAINLKIRPQQSRVLWQSRRIRPDIVLEFKKQGEMEKIIIDTKWKILTDYTPSDEDLRQMYTYNLHMDAMKSVLLYPKLNLVSQEPVDYEQAKSVEKAHSCQLVFADLFTDDGKPVEGVGRRIINQVIH